MNPRRRLNGAAIAIDLPAIEKFSTRIIDDPVLDDVLNLLCRIDDDRRRLVFYEGSQHYGPLVVAAALQGGFLEVLSDNDWLDVGERFAYRLTTKGRIAIGLPARPSFWQRLLP